MDRNTNQVTEASLHTVRRGIGAEMNRLESRDTLVVLFLNQLRSIRRMD